MHYGFVLLLSFTLDLELPGSQNKKGIVGFLDFTVRKNILLIKRKPRASYFVPLS